MSAVRMCGIAGYLTADRVDDAVLPRMLGQLVHRGPDSEGRYASGPYVAGMRRLSINDLATGDQPLYGCTKDTALLYNGEIYNSPDLRRGLERRGHRFHTRSDGEVIPHLYEEVGTAFAEPLDGMFAVALWDERQQRLVLARDIPGEKPLYYTELPRGGIAFASELKALTEFPDLDLSLDLQALWDYPTFLWIPQPATVYRGIRSLPRSHLLVADTLGVREVSYPNRHGDDLPACFDDDASAIAAIRAVVTKSIERRLLSDVPLGAFLSGGLDSSIVATVAATRLPALATFTIGFEDVHDPHHGTADESPFAAQLAARIGSTHTTIRVTADDFRRDLEEFVAAGDQPFAVSSALGIKAVARAARGAGLKVLLSGDCADECFGGYSWYAHLPATVGVMPGHAAPADATVTYNTVGLGVTERIAALATYPAPLRAWAWHYYASEAEKARLFHPDLARAVAPSLRHFTAFNASDVWAPEEFIRQDRESYLVNEMLQKLDHMTMAHSVEGRVPFAAPAVLALADRLAYHHCVRGGTLKWALRTAFADLLSPEVVARPKHGFNVPIEHWLRGPWRDLLAETFAPDSALARFGIIHRGSRDIAFAMVDDHRHLHGHTLFTFVTLNLWLEQVGRRSSPRLARTITATSASRVS